MCSQGFGEERKEMPLVTLVLLDGRFLGPGNGDLKEEYLVILGEVQEMMELLVKEMPENRLPCSWCWFNSRGRSLHLKRR